MRISDFSEFTLHFATINTKYNFDNKIYRDTFTLHFATINTQKDLRIQLLQVADLHYTLLLLIHKGDVTLSFHLNDLHYTLLLLIPVYIESSGIGKWKFTLHFATINTSGSLCTV